MKRIDELRQRLDAVLDEFSDVPLEEIADELDYRASEYQRKANLCDCQQQARMSSELLQYRYDVLASLYWIPCTLQELVQRDFCKNLPTWYIDQILLKLESLGLVVKRKDGVYKAIKGKAKKVLNQRGYEIDD